MLFRSQLLSETRVSEAPAFLFAQFMRIHSCPAIGGGFFIPLDAYSVTKVTQIKWYRVCVCVCLFSLTPGMGIWGCSRLSTTAHYDLPHALAEAWFCQLQIVSVTM